MDTNQTNNLADALPAVKNRSQLQRVAKILFGGTARTWKRNAVVKVAEEGPTATYKRVMGFQVGTEYGKSVTILGSGATPAEALRNVAENQPALVQAALERLSEQAAVNRALTQRAKRK